MNTEGYKLRRFCEKELEKMPVFYVLTKDIRFKEGVEVGRLSKSRFIAIRVLKRGLLPLEEIAEMIDMPLSFVLKIQKELEKNPDLKEK